MLDVALLIAAIATVASALPGLLHGGELLLSVIGELMLCVIASALAIYGRGYLVKQELPSPVRTEPAVISAVGATASACERIAPPVGGCSPSGRASRAR